MDAPARYLDLLERCLTDLLRADRFVGRFAGGRAQLLAPTPERLAERVDGRDWPAFAETMVGLKRLRDFRRCIEDVLERGVAGDILEAGVWRGGASILARAVLEARGDRERCVWLADSFEGLPAPDPSRFPADASMRLHEEKFLAVSLEEVKRGFERYGLLDERVRFVKGWFRDTLPTLRGRAWSVLRLDGDMYESTMQALECLYPGLSEGGWVIVDDYGAIPVCREAVEDFRSKHGIRGEIRAVDWTGICWRKSAATSSTALSATP